LIDLAQPEKTCQTFGLCEADSFLTFIQNEQVIDLDQHVDYVNSNPNSTWTATKNAKFDGATRNQVRQMMGTVVDPEWTVNLHTKTQYKAGVALPENFDAREHWPRCFEVINHVRDQANCGSCWAHGTTEAFNDRMCIATDGTFQTLLSVADTTACCDGSSCFSFGCNGGQVGTPWAWFKRSGVVSGGDYGQGELCYDYTMAECAHHVTVEGLTPCEDTTQVAPVCKAECQSNHNLIYADEKVNAASSYNVSGIDNIKQEIFEHGTVTAAFIVYEDFLTYSEGVYEHQTGASHGGHAIKVVGWGVEEGVDYWLCVNSWNKSWGDKGTFKIKMGDCGINDQMHAGLAQ
jgi:cathepsin B